MKYNTFIDLSLFYLKEVCYKNHKSKKVPKFEWCRTENAHEPIIDKETWYLVQKNQVNMRNLCLMVKFIY